MKRIAQLVTIISLVAASAVTFVALFQYAHWSNSLFWYVARDWWLFLWAGCVPYIVLGVFYLRRQQTVAEVWASLISAIAVTVVVCWDYYHVWISHSSTKEIMFVLEPIASLVIGFTVWAIAAWVARKIQRGPHQAVRALQ